MTSDPSLLRARTRPADGLDALPPHGPTTAFGSPRRALRGAGVALRIDLPAPWPDHVGRVAEALAAIPTDDGLDTPGSGPVAFGALPFDRAAPATLLVPRTIHGRTADGLRWQTTVEDPADTNPAPESAAPEERPDDGHPRSVSELTIRSVRPPEDWCDAVAEATKRIAAGELAKVVLARELTLQASADIDPAAVLDRLEELYPGALCFCVDGFVGASPELLVSRVGDIVRAQPMAGTTPRTGDPDADQRRAGSLLASSKNRDEHQVTIDVVHDALLGFCSYLDAEPAPTVVQAGPVQHLATLVEGRLSMPPASVLDLVAELHPTPAVGGWPRDAARSLIDRLEGADRGRYAGPVGWVDRAGNGAWAVGIRSVELDGAAARLFAGVGVVADSDPLAELDETRAKAQAMLSVLTRV